MQSSMQKGHAFVISGRLCLAKSLRVSRNIQEYRGVSRNIEVFRHAMFAFYFACLIAWMDLGAILDDLMPYVAIQSFDETLGIANSVLLTQFILLTSTLL